MCTGGCRSVFVRPCVLWVYLCRCACWCVCWCVRRRESKKVPCGEFNGQVGMDKARPGQQPSSPSHLSPSFRHGPALGQGLLLWPVILTQLRGCRCEEGRFGREQVLPLPVSAKSFFTCKHVLLCSVTGSRQVTSSCVALPSSLCPS